MRTLVLTGFDDAFAPLGNLTAPLMLDYANRHGFEFQCMRSAPCALSPRDCPHPSWWKMWRLTGALTNDFYGRVIWIDADMVVTNPEFVPPGESGYHCSRDWGRDATEPWMLSNCCFAAFPDCLDMVWWVLANRERFSCEFHEQNHLREAAKGQFRDTTTVHPSRVFAAVPREVHESVVDPWQPGDWVCHLTMLPLAERVKLFGKIRLHMTR